MIYHLIIDIVQSLVYSVFTLTYINIKKEEKVNKHIIILAAILCSEIIIFDYVYVYEGFNSLIYSLTVLVYAYKISTDEKMELLMFSIILNILMSVGNCIAIFVMKIGFRINIVQIIEVLVINNITASISTVIYALIAYCLVLTKRKYKGLLSNYGNYYIIIFCMFFVVITLLEEMIFSQLYMEQNVFLCLFLFVILFIFLLFLQVKNKEDLINQWNTKSLHRQEESLKERFETFEENRKKISIIKHDLNKTLYVINSYLESQDYESAKKNIGQIIQQVETDATLVNTGIYSLDCILSAKSIECEKLGIIFRYIIDEQIFPYVDNFDISIILMNGLENAIENISNKDKKIILTVKKMESSVLIKIDNTVDRQILEENPYLYSHKKW